MDQVCFTSANIFPQLPTTFEIGGRPVRGLASFSAPDWVISSKMRRSSANYPTPTYLISPNPQENNRDRDSNHIIYWCGYKQEFISSEHQLEIFSKPVKTTIIAPADPKPLLLDGLHFDVVNKDNLESFDEKINKMNCEMNEEKI